MAPDCGYTRSLGRLGGPLLRLPGLCHYNSVMRKWVVLVEDEDEVEYVEDEDEDQFNM